MVENTSTPAPGTPKPAKKPKKPAGQIEQQILDDLKLATDCHREAAKSGTAFALNERDWTLAKQTALGTSIAKCDDLIKKIAPAKQFKKKRTEEEETAREQLVQALAIIQKGAKRTFPKAGAPERANFGVGLPTDPSNESTSELVRICGTVVDQFPPTGSAALEGVKPADITALGALVTQYRTADFAQSDAGSNITDLIAQLEAEVKTTLNPARRNLQGAVDQIWFQKKQPNPDAIRRAFGLA